MNDKKMTIENIISNMKLTALRGPEYMYTLGHGMCETVVEHVAKQAAEIDRLRADNQRLRAVIQSAIVGLEVAGDFNLVAAALNERDHLRAALSADAATPADGNGNEVAE